MSYHGVPSLLQSQEHWLSRHGTQGSEGESNVPLMSFSTHVKVMPPSLLLSLNRSRKVPGGLVLRMARSRSLLMNPMMYLGSSKRGEQGWVRTPEPGFQDVNPASSLHSIRQQQELVRPPAEPPTF